LGAGKKPLAIGGKKEGGRAERIKDIDSLTEDDVFIKSPLIDR
jgi:hypothetical protein